MQCAQYDYALATLIDKSRARFGRLRLPLKVQPSNVPSATLALVDTPSSGVLILQRPSAAWGPTNRLELASQPRSDRLNLAAVAGHKGSSLLNWLN